jgi:hypothetical protein
MSPAYANLSWNLLSWSIAERQRRIDALLCIGTDSQYDEYLASNQAAAKAAGLSLEAADEVVRNATEYLRDSATSTGEME